MVGIANSEGVYKMFPHELSGGMRQRVMIDRLVSGSADCHFVVPAQQLQIHDVL